MSVMGGVLGLLMVGVFMLLVGVLINLRVVEVLVTV